MRTDMHKTPLVKGIILKLHISTFDGVKDILSPRNKKPNYRTLLLTDRAKHPLRLNSLKQDSLAAHEKTSEPVHLRSGVIERRYAEEHVVLRLSVMVLLNLA